MGDRIRLSVLTRFLLEDSYNKLITLSESLPDKPDEERKAALIKYFKKAVIQFTRLLVLIKWSDKLQSLQTVQSLVTELERKDALFKASRESLVETVNAAQALKVPLYDIPTATDVLNKRGYKRLPSILEKPHVLMGVQAPRPDMKETEVEEAKARLNEMMRLRLMWSKIPTGFEVPLVKDGKVVLTVANEFEATLTLLQGVTQTAPWTLIKLHFLVAPDPSYGTHYVTTEFNRKVEGICNLAMEANPKDPLKSLFDIAHTFAQNLQLELLASQSEVEKPSAPEAVAPYGRQKVQVQALTHVPGVSLDLTFAGFRLHFSANNATVPAPSSAASSSSASSSTLLMIHSSSAKDVRNAASRGRGTSSGGRHGKKHSSSTSNPTSRGATLTLREKRMAANRLHVESFPSVIDALTGEVAEYEVDPLCVDLEAIVSRARRLYAHEKLRTLATALTTHISASQELLHASVAAHGIENILAATDATLSGTTLTNTNLDTLMALSTPPSTPPQLQTQHWPEDSRSHVLLTLSPEDVSIHINQAMFKSFVSIRLFENYCVYIHLTHTDSQPMLKSGLGLSNAQIERIQAKLRKYEVESNVAEALQELQRQAVLHAFSRLAAPHGLVPSLPMHATPSNDFLRHIGKHYALLQFTEPTMIQSKLVVALDHLTWLPLPTPSSTTAHPASTNTSLHSSTSSVLPSAARHNTDTSGHPLPSISSAFAPLRLRFVLLPSYSPESYVFKHGILLPIPPALDSQNSSIDDASSSSDPTAATAAAAQQHLSVDATGQHNAGAPARGIKRQTDKTATDENHTEQDEHFRDAKRPKLVEDGGHEMITHRDGKASGIAEVGNAPGSIATVGEILARTKISLERKGASMEWHSVMASLVKQSGSEVTRAMLIEDLDRAQAQYKPYGTMNRHGVSTVAGSTPTPAPKDRLANGYHAVAVNGGGGGVKEGGGYWKFSASASAAGSLNPSVSPSSTSDHAPSIDGDSGRSFILSKYGAAPLQIQQLVITIESDRWLVTLTESQSLLPSGFHIDPFVAGVRSTRYFPALRQWRFTYPRGTPFSALLVDLRSLAFVHKIFLQFIALSKTHCPSGVNLNSHLLTPANTLVSTPITPDSAGSSLDLNFFRIVAFSPTSITFGYGDTINEDLTATVAAAAAATATTGAAQSTTSSFKSPYATGTEENGATASTPNNKASSSTNKASSPKVTSVKHAFTISCKSLVSSTTPSLEMTPQISFEPEGHTLTPFINSMMEGWLTDPNLLILLELVWNAHPVLHSIKAFISSQIGTLRSSDLLPVPHGVAKLRVFFRHWCLDWRFLGNRFVCIDEVKRPGEQLALLNFIPFMQTALERISQAQASGVTLNSNPPIDQLTASSSSAMDVTQDAASLTHLNTIDLMTPELANATTNAIASQGRYHVGSNFVVIHSDLIEPLLPMLQAYFGSLRFFMTIEREERGSARQLNENQEHVLPYRRTHAETEVSLILRKPTYILDVIFPSNIAQDEVELLSNMLRTKVVCPPYRMAHLHAFLAIFLLPWSSLSDFISLLRFTRNRTGIMVDIHFPIKEQLVAISVHQPTPEDQDWSITLALLFSRQQDRQEIIMTICYNYKTRQLSSSDAFSTDYLSRNGCAGKAFGSLSGAIDSLTRPLQRAWPSEYSFFLRKNTQLINVAGTPHPSVISTPMPAATPPSPSLAKFPTPAQRN